LSIDYLNVDDAPKPAGPYSQAVIAGDFIFVSGQLGKDPETSDIRNGFPAQAIQVLENIKTILGSAGAKMSDVVKVGVYLRNMSDWKEMNEIYGKYFQPNFPARTTLQTTLRENFLIEVDVVAFRRKSEN